MDFNLIGHWSDPRAFQDPLRLQDIEIRQAFYFLISAYAKARSLTCRRSRDT